VRFQSKGWKLFGRRFRTSGIVATVELSGDRQAGFRSGGSDEFEDLLITVEWFACPSFWRFLKRGGVQWGSIWKHPSDSGPQ
jgi:hypothetical protein